MLRLPDEAGTLSNGLLSACTVRIEVDGAHAGTGFFISRGVVLTAAHVVELQTAAVETSQAGAFTQAAAFVAARASPRIVVYASGAEYKDVQPEPARNWPLEDLAILRIPAAKDHPCVLLDPGVRVGDELQSFGWARPDRAEGTTFEVESEASWAPAPEEPGAAGGPLIKLVKFKEGQAQHGMSGSPVLNLRTGGICGVMTLTRDERQALGGYATSIGELFRLDRALKDANLKFHESDRRWVTLMSPEQRRRHPSLGQRRLDVPSDHIVLTVGRRPQKWRVRGTLFPGDAKLKEVRVDFNPVRVEVARLFRDWASRFRVEEPAQIQLLGEILYRALFREEIDERFTALLAERGEDVLVSLCFEAKTDEDLVRLPWEHLFHRDTGQTSGGSYLATDLWGFERALEPEPRESDAFEQLPDRLNGLLVAARAFSQEQSNWEVDRARFWAEMTATAHGIQFDPLVDPDAPTLGAQLQGGGYDVLHYVGFGRYHSGSDELTLGRAPDGSSYCALDHLADAVPRDGAKLVVLQLCQPSPGAVAGAADLTPLAPMLLTKGVRAVVVHQYPIHPDLAEVFNNTFYGALGAGRPVQAAVQQARTSLKLQSQRRRAFVSPALFVPRPGPLVFATGAAATADPGKGFAARG